MRRTRVLVAAVALIVIAAPGVARAGRVVVLDVRAEADLDDAAGAVTLLLRSSIDGHGRAVVPAPELARVAMPIDRPATLAASMQALDADLVIACDLARSGTGLSASILAVDDTGAVRAAGTAAAGDGDAVALTRALVAVLKPTVGDLTVPAASIGQLRPFVAAAHAVARGDLAAAARAVAIGEPVVALRLPAIAAALRPGWAGAAADRASALAIAQIAGTPKDILELAPGATPRERAARALARLAGAALDDAARELTGKPGREPWLDVAAARLAHARGDRAALTAAVTRLLASPQPFGPGLALLVALPAGAVPPDLEARALAAATTDPSWGRLASVLGLRVAGHGTLAALASVRVVDLDDGEVAQLAPLAAQAAGLGNRDGLRLGAEIAARRADARAVATAVQVWLAAAIDDPAAQLFRGRLALAALRLDEARDAFTAAHADRELARVAMARGDWATAEALLATAPDDSVEKQLTSFQVAFGRGDLAAAGAVIDAARARAPASGAVLRARAVLLDKRGDADRARADRALAERVAPGVASTVDLAAKASSQPAAGAGTSGATTLPSGDDGLVRELAAMLPPLDLDRASSVAVVGVVGPRAGWWSLREANPAPLAPALTAAVRAAGKPVVAGGPAWVSEPIDVDKLSAIAGDVGASHLLLYRLAADGGRAHLRLILFERGVANARAFEASLDGSSTGLVRWNRDRITLIVGALLILGVFGLALVIRGRSRIAVFIERDPDGSDEVLAIELSRSPRRPSVGDPAAFRKDSLRVGHQLTDHSARLPSDRTVFRVSPGVWYVHVFGVYTREFGDRVVPPMHSQQVTVGRGAHVEARFDLGLPVAEVKVTIHDDKRQGIAVWLDDAQADKVYTDAAGQVTLYATVGSHTMFIDPGDLRIEKPLPISAAKIEKVIINLPRERRLAEVSDGLTLAPTEHGPAAAPLIDAAIGARLTEPPPFAAPAATPVVIAPVVASAPTQIMGAGQPAAASPAATAGASQRITAVTDAVVASTVLGRYRLDAELGSGAMGVVYRGWDLRLERTVAVKVMARAVREVPNALAFFEQEAKALAQLNHPNIVAVYDQVTDGLEHYMVMEFVDGMTLEKLLTDRGRLSVRQALGVVDQLCTGLAYAHGKKVIHRDIKPANVFISREKVVKLGDFGLARVMREIEIRQTDVRGTPLYMAPEQVSGTNINHRADLYAVGCTLFELCAGRPPFIDGNVMHHHLVTEPPVLSSLCPEAPAALDALVADCLAKDAMARIDSAAAICERVRAIAAAL
ncbi:MAG: serine/threonine protein kinase [Myxococcales bacterium]|nr:serine/threonine protein kinase [Myxococcales bacterium]MBK7195261.1 serine/threonine protein kinase [Myxococcales bacterium]MBP6845279.1 serine/threonine protein kinase [Kofleriaceae bacterium]